MPTETAIGSTLTRLSSTISIGTVAGGSVPSRRWTIVSASPTAWPPNSPTGSPRKETVPEKGAEAGSKNPAGTAKSPVKPKLVPGSVTKRS